MRAAFLGGRPRLTTPGGVPLPVGWNLVRADTFGTTKSVANYAQLHALYDEGQYYNKDTNGLIVSNPINSQQQTYQHFETSIAFSTDHLTIQGRGQVGGAIFSAQMSSHYSSRSFCFEGRFTVPSTAGTWVEFWGYPIIAAGSDASEIDVEMVISSDGSNPSLATDMVSLANHPTEFTNIVINDSHFTTTFMFWINSGFNISTGPHYYTVVYDDVAKKLKRYIDGSLIYITDWTWMASLGGTGFGADANCTIDLAMGGSFPGTIAAPASYSGDLNLYSISYYSPVPVPAGQAWDQSHKCGSVFLSTDSLTATTQTSTTSQNIYAIKAASSGRYYWEVVITSGSNIANCAAGLGVTIVAATGLVGTTQQGQYLGQQNYQLGWFPSAAFTNNGPAGGAWPAFASGDVLCFALDLNSHLFWVRVGAAGLWFGLAIGSQNPAVGSQVGGYTLPSTLQTNVCPAAFVGTVGDTVVGHFTSGSWAGTPPTGFGAF